MTEFFVSGIPQPKGSTRSHYSHKQKRVFTRNANKETAPWEATIRAAASAAGCTVSHGGIRVYAIFLMPRIKGHFRKSGELKPTAPPDHVSKPDLDKLIRTLLDGLTALAFVDDSQVAEIAAVKWYTTEEPGVHVVVEPIDEVIDVRTSSSTAEEAGTAGPDSGSADGSEGADSE